jgi:hypothetical protein
MITYVGIFYNFYNTFSFFLLALRIFKEKNSENFNQCITSLCSKNCLCLLFFFSIFQKIQNNGIMLLKSISFKNIKENSVFEISRNILISFFQLKTILQSATKTVFECIGILLFCKRQFSFHSTVSFISFMFIKLLHDPWSEKFKVYKKNADQYSKKNQMISIIFLSVLVHFETFLSKTILNSHRKRLVNCIVGTELINLSFLMRGFLIDQVFFFSNKFFIKNKWISIENCSLHLKILICINNLFSYYIGIISVANTNKGIFRYYFLNRLFTSIKEVIEYYQELTRFRKTNLCIKYWMKTPSIENIEKLGDKMCAICRDEMTPDFCKILNCGHIYHTGCLQDWLRRQYCCPTCLVPITSPIKGNDVTMKNAIYQKFRNKQLNIIAAVTGFSSNKNGYDTFYLDKKNSKLLPSLSPSLNQILFNFQKSIPVSSKQLLDKKNLENYVAILEKIEKIRLILYENFLQLKKNYLKLDFEKKEKLKVNSWKKIKNYMFEQKMTIYKASKNN